jgi:hypothetical protein
MNGIAGVSGPDQEKRTNMGEKRKKRVGSEETISNFWSAIVLTPPLSVRFVRSLGVTSSCTEGRIVKRRWERGGVRWIVHHLWCAKRSRRRRWHLKLWKGVRRRVVVVDESAGGCNLGTLVLHVEPDGESSDYTECGETPHNTSSNGTCMRTSASTLRAVY